MPMALQETHLYTLDEDNRGEVEAHVQRVRRGEVGVAQAPVHVAGQRKPAKAKSLVQRPRPA